LKDRKEFDEELQAQVKNAIRKQLSPRHVPHRIFAVADIPFTRNGKKMEIAVSQTIHGIPVKNASAIANPECLEEFARIAARGFEKEVK
jgi:acetoacetyl-CoA synthetase